MLLFALWLLSRFQAAHGAFTEQLTLRPLPAINHVLVRLESSINETSRPSSGAPLVPTVLRQILEKYDVESLHLSFAVGRYVEWRYGSFHSSNGSDFVHVPFGTRLQATLRGNASISQRWKGITSQLGGIFSASLNQMDETVVTGLLPSSSPLELGAFSLASADPDHTFLHGSLAREELCTENLTPWLKMLPCRAIAGLGSMIDPINVLSGEYLSLSLFAARSQDGTWTLRQHLTTVLNPSPHNSEHWSLGSLFFGTEQVGAEVRACPLADKSVILTEDTKDKEPSFIIEVTDLREKPVLLSSPWFDDWKTAVQEEASLQNSVITQQDVVSVHRFVTGYGQVHGGIAVQLKNNHPSRGMLVTYHDVIPWYLRLYFHTFRATIGGSESKAQELIRAFDFVPAELRNRPNQLRIVAFLPANTMIVFSLRMEKAFLYLSKHPPDANRGFDIAPGVATFSASENDSDDSVCGKNVGFPSSTTILFTEPLLVPLSTPDFSMPYNVITMTSTVVAFFVGTMLNTLLRKAPRLQRMMTK
uniref:GPI transamidase component PIG-T n=1 Tax=Peronospora matthiolae TaxID=2874970 RepID=A0AAV1UK18_9STRA